MAMSSGGPPRPRKPGSRPTSDGAHESRHGLVLSTRTASEAARGALVDQLRAYTGDDMDAASPTRASSPTPPTSPPRALPAAAPAVALEADDSSPDIGPPPHGSPSDSAAARRMKVDHAVRTYVRELRRTHQVDTDVLAAVAAAVQEGTTMLPSSVAADLARAAELVARGTWR